MSPQNQYSWHRYVASWCLLMAPLQENPKLKPHQNHKNYESTLQLWMLWCPWHQSIHSCRVDPCGTPKYESKFKIFKMIKKCILEFFCAAYVESYTFRPVLNCVWWRCLCPAPQLREGDRHRNDFNKKKVRKRKIPVKSCSVWVTFVVTFFIYIGFDFVFCTGFRFYFPIQAVRK